MSSNTVNPLSDFEKMGKYTCGDRLSYLNLLDSYKLKSNLTPAQKTQLSFYDILKNQYLLGGCGEDLKKDSCFDLETKIQLMQSAIDNALKQGSVQPIEISQQLLKQYKDAFEKNGCEAKINDVKTGLISEIIDKNQSLDEQRINEQTKKMVKQRILFGGLFVVIAFVLIVYKTKTKK